MNILELLSSTYKLDPSRRPDYVFGSKPFGHIYAYNKMIKYKSKYSIIELSMIMGVYTEKNRAAHKVSIALQGVESTEYSTEDLIDMIKKENKHLENLEDIDILNNVLKEIPLLKDKVILQKESNKNKFAVFSKKISLKTQVRVHCSCSDYYFTYEWYNADHKVNIGVRPPKYQRYVGLNKKQKEEAQPVRNPRKLPGVCKHLLLFLALLMSGGVINEKVEVVSNLNKNSVSMEIMSRKDITKLLTFLKAELVEEGKKQKYQKAIIKENLKDYTKLKKEERRTSEE